MGNLLGVDRKIEYLQKLAALSGIRGAARLVEIAALSKNQGPIQKLENFFGKMAVANQSEVHPFLPGPFPEDVGTGEIILSLLPDGSAVRLPIELLSQGLCIFGTTGSGKTWLLAFICKQLIENGINVWIFVQGRNRFHRGGCRGETAGDKNPI